MKQKFLKSNMYSLTEVELLNDLQLWLGVEFWNIYA